ncbi:hypothetical protein ACFQGE_15440 [Halomicroarcula sp. GCM10025817]|uniref:hypothetical protein n=1 Tax=Haloarcula TaxID=2237 RepID=UPI0023E87534|nr:hypothetical protein [Halomicroarcula sp. SYNS111]
MADESTDSNGTLTDKLPGGTATSLLLLVGVLLFVVPEPITSVIGALFLATGIGLWLSGKLLS